MRLWSIQIARFFAALAVVFHHAGSMTAAVLGRYGLVDRHLIAAGRAGVDVFFVISGVVIAWAARETPWRAFALRRWRRIWPLYAVVSLPFFLGAAVGGAASWRLALATFALWPATDVITNPVLSAVAWTLCFEALFYLAVTLFLWRPWTLAGCALVFLAALPFPQTAAGRFLGNPMIVEFLIGVALSRLPPMKWAVWLLPLGVIGLIVGGSVLDPTVVDERFAAGAHAWRRVAMMGVPAALTILALLQWQAKPGVLTYLGDTSYALYLVHAPVVAFVVVVLHRVAPWAGSELVMLAAMGVAVLAAWRVYEAVDKPLMAWLSRRRAAPQPA